MKRLFAIAVIWLGCTVAWLILGGAVHLRTDSLSGSLTDEVYALWGPPGRQAPPLGTYQKIEKSEEKVVEQTSAGSVTRTVVHETKVDVPVALDASNVHVKLALEQQRKGLMWFPTYGVDFHADYSLLNDNLGAHDVSVHFPLRSPEDGRSAGAGKNGSFDGFAIVDSHGTPVEFQITGDDAVFSQHFEPGERRAYGISYRTRGTTSFRYLMAQGTGRVHDLTVSVDTNFGDVNFPTDTLSPTSRVRTSNAFHGEWHFASLVSTSDIGIELPQLLNPGPLATKVTLFAPVSLLFFFFVVAVLSQVRGHELHPMHYFLFSCAFFAFHLLFAYLVDRFAIGTSFAIASAVSVFLVVSYARLFVGWKFALREMGIAQVLYLVLFSYTFFWEGFTGLAITIGAIATLFFVMQVTGRTDWTRANRERRTRQAELAT
ncbi:MAG TPA: inner membrane CreD family protein [Polyangiaceae bacterium]